MKRLTAILATLLLTLALTSPASAVTASLRLYPGDGGGGGFTCITTTTLWDANLGNGVTNGSGTCAVNWDNTIESLRLHFAATSECWILYTGINYGGTAHVFQNQLEGFYEVPGINDNIFSSFSKGTDGAGSSCIAQHP